MVDVCVNQAVNSGTGAAGVGLLPAAGATPAVLPAVMSAIKRPALVDHKTGLPVYQPLPAAAAPAGSMPYHQLSLQPHARYITLPGDDSQYQCILSVCWLMALWKAHGHCSTPA